MSDQNKRSDEASVKDMLARKRKELSAIQRVLVRLEQGHSPKKTRAIFGSAVVTGIAIFLTMKFGAVRPDAMWPLVAFAAWFFIAFGTYEAVKKYSAAPWSLVPEMDRLLGEYEPLAPDDFSRLQAHTRECGYLDLEQVREWLSSELSAIDEIQNPRATRFAFAAPSVEQQLGAEP